MCRICTDPLELLLGETSLNCFGCPDLVAIPDTLTRLTMLNCSYCPRLTTISPALVALTSLDCTGCPLVASIPSTLIHLDKLYCLSCPLLASIPDTLVALTRLACSRCPRLVSVPGTLAVLTSLVCSHCPRLTSIPDTSARILDYLDCNNSPLVVSIPRATWTYCYGCPWLPGGATDYSIRLLHLLRLQRWFRHGKKQVFKRVIRTRAFNEFVFHPDRIGGKAVKRQMEAELGQMRPAKQQRVE